MNTEPAPLDAPQPKPLKRPSGFGWSWAMAASASVTSLSLAMPWQNTIAGGVWAFAFPEGWLAVAACLLGLVASGLALRWSKPARKRRSLAGLSVLGSILMLAAVGAFAIRVMRAQDGGGSGPGSVFGSIAVLAWTFLAVSAHKAIGAEAKPLRRSAASK